MIETLLLVVLAAAGLVAVLVPPSARSTSSTPPGESDRDAGEPSAALRVPLSRLALAGAAVAALSVAAWLGLPRQDRGSQSLPFLAVLPFEPIGEQDPYISAGLTDELSTRLSRVSALRVASVTLGRAIARGDADPDDLGVEFLLEGSVSVAEGDEGYAPSVHVRTRLVDATTGTQQWSAVYDVPQGEMIDVQGTIATSVVGELGLELSAEEQALLGTPRTRSAEAAERYLAGITYRRRFRQYENGELARRAFLEATELDPEFAGAWGALGGTLLWLASEHGLSGQLENALAAIERGRQLDPGDIDVRLADALRLWMIDLDIEGALDAYEQARPTSDVSRVAVIDYFTSLMLERKGDEVGSLSTLESSLERDPFVAFQLFELAERHLRARRFDDARRVLDRGFATGVRDWRSGAVTALLLLGEGGTSGEAAAALHDLGPLWAAETVFDGLRPEARLLARVTAQELDASVTPDPLLERSQRARAGAALSEAFAAQVRGDVAEFDGALPMLDSVASDGSLPPHLHFWARAGTAIALAGAGRAAESEHLLDSLTTSNPRPGDLIFELPLLFAKAEAAALSGRPDDAAAAVTLLLSRPSPLTPEALRRDPLLAPFGPSALGGGED